MATRVDGRSGVETCTFPALKEQQLVFLLVRQLATAQFVQAQPELCQRLWQEVEALGIDPERITWLLYGGQDHGDRAVLAALDQVWCRAAVRTTAAAHRTAPPAAPRAHR